MDEMPFPACRVLALAQSARLGPVEHRLDAAADAARRRRLLVPDRRQHRHDVGGVDRRHRQPADDRIGILGERAAPLAGVLGVAPAGALCGDVAVGSLAERHRLGRLHRLLGAFGGALLQRVAAGAEDGGEVVGGFSGGGERHRASTGCGSETQAHGRRPPRAYLKPRTSPSVCVSADKIVAVGVAPWRRLRHRRCCQSLRPSRHRILRFGCGLSVELRPAIRPLYLGSNGGGCKRTIVEG